MELTEKISRNNFYSYLWHAGFLALAQNFMDVDTIIPAMLIEAGGTAFHIGLLTAIMLGGSTLTQLFFSPFLSNKPLKKNFLLLGINVRVISLLGLGILLYLYSDNQHGYRTILLIFLLISIFSISGAFAGINYTDILGKSILENSRKSFFSLRQTIMSIGVFISAIFAAKTLVAFEYPNNYSSLFVIAALALGVASFGFWKIKEIKADSIKIKGLREFRNVIIQEIRSNNKLVNYLFVVNSLGISIALLPFLVLYSKTNFLIGNAEVGQYLLFKVVASVITGSLLFYFSKKMRYSYLLYTIAAISVIIPLHIMLFSSLSTFGVYFIAGGIVFTLYKVAIDGVLLEVSTNQNRTIYVGLVGAGSVLPALFPVIGGMLIEHFGFTSFFVLYLSIIMFSFYFIHRLNCQK